MKHFLLAFAIVFTVQAAPTTVGVAQDKPKSINPAELRAREDKRRAVLW